MPSEATPAAPAAPAAPAVAPAAPAPSAAVAALLDSAAAATAPAAAPAPAAPAAAPAPAEPATVALPGKDATPEAWQAYYKAIGAPETGEAYALPVPDGGDAAFAAEAAGMMAKAGLLPQQALALAEWWNGKAADATKKATEAAAKAETDRIAALDAKNKAEEAELRTEWGQKADENMGRAQLAAKNLLGPKAADILTAIENTVGYKATMKLMHSLGKGLGTGQAHGLDGEGGHKDVSHTSIREQQAAKLYPNS